MKNQEIEMSADMQRTSFFVTNVTLTGQEESDKLNLNSMNNYSMN